jgi:hypothetical protein
MVRQQCPLCDNFGVIEHPVSPVGGPLAAAVTAGLVAWLAKRATKGRRV